MSDDKQTRKRTKSNGEGSIREEMHNGRKRWKGTITIGYEPVVDDDGVPVLLDNGEPKLKQLRRVVTGATKKDVIARMSEAQTASSAGLAPARRELTVAKFLEDWLTNALPGTVAPSTLQQYRDVCRYYIIPIIGQKRLVNLAPTDVAKMVRTLGTEYKRKDGTIGLAPHTQRIARSVLRRALRWAEKEGMLARNVAQLADGVKVGESAGRTLTPEQARALLDSVADHRLAAAYTVALSLGLRLGELLGLAWSDLELDATPPRLTVHRALKRIDGVGLVLDTTKTKASRRTVHLPPTCVAALRTHRTQQVAERLHAGPLWTALPLESDLVFRTPFGLAIDPDNFRHTTYKVTEDAGLGRWSPHELRHSCASLLIAQGVPLKLVSELLGHTSIRITADVYGHLLEPAKAEVADAMERALGGGA